MTMERICDIIFTIHVKLAPTVVRIPLEESMYRKVLTSQGENALWAVRPDTGHRYRVQLFLVVRFYHTLTAEYVETYPSQ